MESEADLKQLGHPAPNIEEKEDKERQDFEVEEVDDQPAPYKEDMSARPKVACLFLGGGALFVIYASDMSEDLVRDAVIVHFSTHDASSIYVSKEIMARCTDFHLVPKNTSRFL